MAVIGADVVEEGIGEDRMEVVAVEEVRIEEAADIVGAEETEAVVAFVAVGVEAVEAQVKYEYSSKMLLFAPCVNIHA